MHDHRSVRILHLAASVLVVRKRRSRFQYCSMFTYLCGRRTDRMGWVSGGVSHSQAPRRLPRDHCPPPPRPLPSSPATTALLPRDHCPPPPRPLHPSPSRLPPPRPACALKASPSGGYRARGHVTVGPRGWMMWYRASFSQTSSDRSRPHSWSLGQAVS